MSLIDQLIVRLQRHPKRVVFPEGGDPRIVVAAAVLHDIGIQEAERKHGSSGPQGQELEGPPIARRRELPGPASGPIPRRPSNALKKQFR